MINKYLKTIGSFLIVGFFLILAFGSDDSTTSSSNTTNSKSLKKSRTVYSGGYTVEVDLTPPAGCVEGATCSGCDGVGVTNYMRHDMICPSCNGKGFLWLEKNKLSKQNSNVSEAEYSNEVQTYNYSINDVEHDNSDSNEKSNSTKPRYKIYDLGYSTYIEAESKCRNRNMRLPNYDELLEIANSPDLLKNLTTNNKSLGYWSSSDYIDGEPFDNKESIQGNDSKNYKKNYNPFTDKTIMTDTRLSKNCVCIEKLEDNNNYTLSN